MKNVKLKIVLVNIAVAVSYIGIFFCGLFYGFNESRGNGIPVELIVIATVFFVALWMIDRKWKELIFASRWWMLVVYVILSTLAVERYLSLYRS